MASFNSAFFLTLLVAISAFMAAPSSVEAQILPPLIRIANISGIVPCSINGTGPANGNVSINGTVTNPLPFANATVSLVCGNTIVATTTTNPLGFFNFLLNGIQNLFLILSSLLSGGNCRVVVTTPLAQCNSSLPTTGGLLGNLTQIASTVGGLLNIFVPNFTFSGPQGPGPLRSIPIL